MTRISSRIVAAAAAAAALTGTAVGTAAADEAPGKAAVAAQKQQAQARGTLSGDAPYFSLKTIDKAGKTYFYSWDYKGKLEKRIPWLDDERDTRLATQSDLDQDGIPEGETYFLTGDGSVILERPLEDETERKVASGFGKYDIFLTPGNLGGGKESDLLTRDKQGVLWLHLARPDGSFTGAKKIGGGWGQYTQITGKGDLTGDRKADIVARDKDGVLWLYKGTGDWKKPFAARTKIGTGWNQFNLLHGAGDTDYDGHTDLIARDKSGALWRYKGTGKASAPFKAKEKIGASGWNQYRLVY
ncbi:VCBS repeat-containing protein [Streptomyces sp. AV19]|uniref:FG-GAP repeat domain-containing protein n=1 Tax=Streptomyces sp. AV19 TaxID=2793068 RepID=UPI0018FE1C1B|nr:VCBS repeat-containing protein [Streptomyces sp. AV19]MBH1938412.1 VCBS repeat-containing protein [Streptomyces sp. AV19]MDG4535061.1 VCBS repeat-containing protein [Streptomyces sp. AV19]